MGEWPALDLHPERRAPTVDAAIQAGNFLWWGIPPAGGGVDMALEERIMDGTARGGVVYTPAEQLDYDTGEILGVEYLVVRNHHGRVAFDRIPAGRVGRVDPPDQRTITAVVRLLARDIAAGRGRVGVEERRALDVIRRIAGAVQP